MQQANKLRNFDDVEVKDYETYMKSGICVFWAITNLYSEDSTKLRELANKYGYGVYTTPSLNMYEVIKRGATFQDRSKQMKNENLSVLLGVA